MGRGKSVRGQIAGVQQCVFEGLLFPIQWGKGRYYRLLYRFVETGRVGKRPRRSGKGNYGKNKREGTEKDDLVRSGQLERNITKVLPCHGWNGRWKNYMEMEV